MLVYTVTLIESRFAEFGRLTERHERRSNRAEWSAEVIRTYPRRDWARKAWKMKSVSISMMVIGLACFASAASADVSGRWRVTGKVSSFAFTLNCDFKPDGARLGGVCVDAATNNAKVKAGKSHVLTAGSVLGDKVSWTYRSSFLLSKFDVTYRGAVSGARMSGSIDAQGHAGAFTAVKQ